MFFFFDLYIYTFNNVIVRERFACTDCTCNFTSPCQKILYENKNRVFIFTSVVYQLIN